MTQKIFDILKVVGDVFALVTAILAIVAFAIRHYLKERISAAFKAQFARENEKYKHQLSEQLEAYRASLLTTLEEYKLAIDIRRSIALEFAKQRMNAYQKICRDFGSILVDTYAWAITSPDAREEKNAFLIRTLDRASQAKNQVNEFAYFIDPVEIGAPFATLYRDIVHVFPDHMEDKAHISELITSYGYLVGKMRAGVIEESHLKGVGLQARNG